MTTQDENEDTGSRLMKAVEAIGISPHDARTLVANYRRSAERAHPGKQGCGAALRSPCFRGVDTVRSRRA